MGQKPNNVFKKTHIPVKHKNRGTQKRATKSKFILHHQQSKEPVTNSVKKTPCHSRTTTRQTSLKRDSEH